MNTWGTLVHVYDAMGTLVHVYGTKGGPCVQNT